MKKAKTILGGLLAVSVVLNIYQYTQLTARARQVPFGHGDDVIIERAIRRYVGSVGVQREEAMRGRFPIVAITPQGLYCVNLRIRRNGTGTTPTYCFDRSGRLLSEGIV